jgi:hypothetical protein
MSAPNISFFTESRWCLQTVNRRLSSVGRKAISRKVDPLFETGGLLLGLGEVAVEALL